eukprot:scaffold410533_cov18-Prasinocladus_malaysianus.AAC.3
MKRISSWPREVRAWVRGLVLCRHQYFQSFSNNISKAKNYSSIIQHRLIATRMYYRETTKTAAEYRRVIVTAADSSKATPSSSSHRASLRCDAEGASCAEEEYSAAGFWEGIRSFTSQCAAELDVLFSGCT